MLKNDLKTKRLHAIRGRELKLVLESTAISFDTHILEIGCGDGYQSAILGSNTTKLISTDITTGRTTNLNIICDAQDLPFKDNVFDVVYSSNVLEHIPNKTNALNEMMRCLNNVGIIIIMVPTSTWKALQCIMYYIKILPLQFSKFIKMRMKLQSNNKAGTTTKKGTTKENIVITQIKKYSVPSIHGTSKTNCEEFLMFRVSSWMKLFKTVV